MIRQIQYRCGEETFDHDDEATETTMRDNLRFFFEKRRGDRETFHVYRGFVFVRKTAVIDGRSRRMTIVYVYVSPRTVGNWGSAVYVSDADGIADAKRRIDAVLERGTLRGA